GNQAMDYRRGKWLMLPGILGAALGAQAAVDLDERMMRLLIGIVMVVMFFVVLVKPEAWLKGSGKALRPMPTPWEWLLYLAIGFYGGLIQAGVGIFLLAGLVLVSGYDLVKANALKLLFVLIF